MGENPIRTPRQKRSIEKKARILKAAYDVFCKTGYYDANTSEIAAAAGVSVGCLYSYFSDKHAIFMETYAVYQKQFENMHLVFEDMITTQSDPKLWFREYMRLLIEAHDNSLTFQRELKMLYYRDPEIQAEMDSRNHQIEQTALKYLKLADGLVRVEDVEAVAVVCTTIMGAVVDKISLSDNTVERERLFNEGVKAVCRYLGV